MQGGSPHFAHAQLPPNRTHVVISKKSFGYSKIISSSSSFLPGPPPYLDLPPFFQKEEKNKQTGKSCRTRGLFCFSKSWYLRWNNIYTFYNLSFFIPMKELSSPPTPPLPSCKGKPKTGGGGSQMNQAAARSMKRKRGGDFFLLP